MHQRSSPIPLISELIGVKDKSRAGMINATNQTYQIVPNCEVRGDTAKSCFCKSQMKRH